MENGGYPFVRYGCTFTATATARLVSRPRWYGNATLVRRHRLDDATRTSSPGAPSAAPAGLIVTGPNHALHAILTLLTFWMCGGWAWIWLLAALGNKKRVQPVDAYGNILPPTPQQLAAQQDQRRQQVITVAVIAGILVLILVLSAVIH